MKITQKLPSSFGNEAMTSSIRTILQSPASMSVHESELRRRQMLSPYQSNSVAACSPFHPKLRIRNGSRLICSCSLTPGGTGSAVAEALNERIESTIGEILSALGRLQAEQLKQVQEFQDEVLERAKRAKEKAAREAKESQGLPVKSSTTKANSTSTNSSAVPSTITVAPNNKDSGSGKDDTAIGISNIL